MADIIQIVINGVTYDLKDVGARHEKPDWNAAQDTPAEILNKPDLSQFVTKAVDDLVNYYLMSETYSKSEVDDLIAAVSGLSFFVVDILPEASVSTMGSIYLVPSSDPEAGNVKDEYITIRNTEGGHYIYSWEIIGSTDIDLSNYYTKAEVDTALGGKVDKVQGKGLSTNDYDNTAKGLVDALPTAIGGLQQDKEDKSNKVSSWSGTPNNDHYPSEKLVKDSLDGKQATIDSSHKLPYSLVSDTPDLSGFITKSVNDLTNYYLKSETYTKSEVEALIAAINQFHYEIYASTSAVTSPATNVLYLIGPTGSGADKYEEYVYSNNVFVKIGDTSIDLSGYVTTSALNTALADYTTTAALTLLLQAKQDVIDSTHKLPYAYISDTPVIPDVTGKADKVSGGTTDNFAALDANGNLKDSGHKHSDYLTSHQDISGKADKVNGATNGNFAGLDSNGNLTDSGKKASDFLTSHQDISGKEDKSNKVTSFGSTPSDTKYPSEKLVKDSLDAKQPTIDASHKLDYSLIDNTPAIPAAQIQSDWNQSDNTAKDFIKNKPTIPTVPVTDVTVGGTSVVSNGTAAVPAIPTVPTISTNIQTDKASDVKTASPKAVYDEVHPATGSSQPAGGMLPNKLYKLGTLTGNVSIAFASPSDNTIENEYKFSFTAGSTAPTITWPNSITKWAGNALDSGLPNVEADTYYEVSVEDGIAIINKFE